MSEKKLDRHREYQCRLELGAGHRKFGLVAPRKEPKDDDEGGDGSSELNPWNQAHPLLANAAQFSGDHKFENPVVHENPTGEKQLQHRHEAKLEKQMQAKQHINPTPSSPR